MKSFDDLTNLDLEILCNCLNGILNSNQNMAYPERIESLRERFNEELKYREEKEAYNNGS